jgi:hypothetical protein
MFLTEIFNHIRLIIYRVNFLNITSKNSVAKYLNISFQ